MDLDKMFDGKITQEEYQRYLEQERERLKQLTEIRDNTSKDSAVPPEPKPSFAHLASTEVQLLVHVVIRTRDGDLLVKNYEQCLPGALRPEARGQLLKDVLNYLSGAGADVCKRLLIELQPDAPVTASEPQLDATKRELALETLVSQVLPPA